MNRVKNFAGFMKSRLNEDGMAYSSHGGVSDGSMTPYGETHIGSDHNEFGYPESPDFDAESAEDIEDEWYGANPEEDEEVEADAEEGMEEEEEVTLQDLKAMIEDLTERIEKLEGGEEGEEGTEEGTEEEGAEGEEGAEEPAAEGEEEPAK